MGSKELRAAKRGPKRPLKGKMPLSGHGFANLARASAKLALPLNEKKTSVPNVLGATSVLAEHQPVVILSLSKIDPKLTQIVTFLYKSIIQNIHQKNTKLYVIITIMTSEICSLNSY